MPAVRGAEISLVRRAGVFGGGDFHAARVLSTRWAGGSRLFPVHSWLAIAIPRNEKPAVVRNVTFVKHPNEEAVIPQEATGHSMKGSVNEIDSAEK
jgi:hypothetical protein